MSKYSSQLVAPSQIRMTLGPISRPAREMRYVSIVEFEQIFSCKINSLPQNVCLMGWLKSEHRWYCAPMTFSVQSANNASFVFHQRGLDRLLRFMSQHIVDLLEVPTLWFPFCFYDAWRERHLYSDKYRWVTPPDLTNHTEWRGEPGELPVLSPTQHWLACFGAHQGDPSALLQPDPHYLGDYYAELFAELVPFKMPWSDRKSRTVLGAGDHGESCNLFAPLADRTVHSRRLFKAVVTEQKLEVDVFLGQPVSRAEQLGYRYIADVDGFARTWDAWAWKMMSGSTVLAVESPWISFFSEQFAPWEHYVPVNNDSSDLGEKLEWCRSNSAECSAIAQRAGERASIVYGPSTVAEVLLEKFSNKLADPPPPDFTVHATAPANATPSATKR